MQHCFCESPVDARGVSRGWCGLAVDIGAECRYRAGQTDVRRRVRFLRRLGCDPERLADIVGFLVRTSLSKPKSPGYGNTD